MPATTKNPHGIDPRADWYSLLEALATAGIFPGPRCTRVLLYGPPGTGKSSAAMHLWPRRRIERVTLHRDMSPDDLVGTYGLRSEDGATVTEFQMGPAARAMRSGAPLVLDEVTEHSDTVRCMLHAILDDPDIACLTLPDGAVVKPRKGFAIVGTTNKTPGDLDEAILDRFELILPASTPAPGILRGLSNAAARVISAKYKATDSDRWEPQMTIRRMMALEAMALSLSDMSTAAALIFGSMAKDVLSMIAAQKKDEDTK